jgi:hypothetical protein
LRWDVERWSKAIVLLKRTDDGCPCCCLYSTVCLKLSQYHPYFPSFHPLMQLQGSSAFQQLAQGQLKLVLAFHLMALALLCLLLFLLAVPSLRLPEPRPRYFPVLLGLHHLPENPSFTRENSA